MQLDYTVISKISEGTFGIVYKAEFNKNHKIFALKELKDKANDQSRLIKKATLMEIYACQNLHHKNIVNCFKYTFDGKIRIFMEYCQQKINALYMKNLQQKDRKSIYKQLLQALAYFDENHFIHCDIKPDNIMVYSKANSDYSYQLIPKLCDYGLGIIDQQIKHEVKLSGGYAFTDGYRPPEVVFGVDITCKSDVFSLGVTFLQLLVEKNIFVCTQQAKSQQQIFKDLYGDNIIQYVKADKDTQLKVKYDFVMNEIQHMREYQDNKEELTQEGLFLCKLLEPNMKIRQSAKELLKDPFLQDVTEKTDEMLAQNDIYRDHTQELTDNFFIHDNKVLQSYKFM